ncbi:hypothetical protein V492_06521 [Pseudogymnoascus sp. VKM F-4246]|nr:hypothetical protein V492_06521 [Pseudogymnoascus sp. VKM F-4246]
MQLDLLEQQNQKTLMMARQEQVKAESADELGPKQGVDTQTPVDNEPSTLKHERHPTTLSHRPNRPVDTQPSGPPLFQGVEASSSTSTAPLAGEQLHALPMQYMRYPLLGHTPFLTYDPQSTALERYYANSQLIERVELSRIGGPMSYSPVDAGLLGAGELQLELQQQGNRMRMLAALMKGREEYGHIVCKWYFDDNGCLQPSGGALWLALKRGLDFKEGRA